jgi:hypothetical protein
MENKRKGIPTEGIKFVVDYELIISDGDITFNVSSAPVEPKNK